MRAGLILALAAGSCTTWRPPSVEPFYAGDLASAERVLRARVEQADGDWILMANELATCLEAQGRYTEAWRLFYDAGRAMAVWDTSFGESFAAMAGREDAKEFKGDPYEQAFNSIYTGLLYWLRGEPDNARACFKEAMLRDADSTDDRFKSDLALSFWLAALASRVMGLRGDAEQFLTEARAARADAVAAGAAGGASLRCFEDVKDANVVVVASVGRGPVKVATGRNREVVRFQSMPSRVTGAAVSAAGRRLGETEVLADVLFQAATRGGRWMDGLRKGKAVFKQISKTTGVVLTSQGLARRGDRKGSAMVLAGIGALLLASAIRAEADVRCWQTLPGTVQVLARRLPPGPATLQVDFLGPNRAVLPGFRRHVDVDVPEHGVLVLHLRSVPRLPGEPAR